MAKPLAYSHGRYYGMGEELGSFGYSVRKAEKEDSDRKDRRKTGWKKSAGNWKECGKELQPRGSRK